MKKRYILLFVILLILVCGFIFSIFYLNKPQVSNHNTTYREVVAINYSNFQQEISKNKVIQDLPNNAIILLRFYNFDTGMPFFTLEFIVSTSGLIVNIVVCIFFDYWSLLVFPFSFLAFRHYYN